MRRWCFILLGLWLTVGGFSFWQLRETLQQLAEYFTWAALRYGLIFHRLAAAGLGLCLGLTLALMINESRYQLCGLSRRERHHLLRILRRRSRSNR